MAENKINVVEKSREFSKPEIFMMTKSPEIMSLQKIADGTVIEVDSYLCFTDENKTGETVEIMSLRSTEGDVYAVQSPTAKQMFYDICDIMEGEFPIKVKKISGQAKSGRTYINLTLAT